jgi:hypothetical protein
METLVGLLAHDSDSRLRGSVGGKATEFDREECLRRLRRVEAWNYYADWSPVELRMDMDPREARFWLEAMLSLKSKWVDSVAEGLAYAELPGNLDGIDVRACIDSNDVYSLPHSIVLPLYVLMGIDGLCDLVLQDPVKVSLVAEFGRCWLINGFITYILPNLGEEERERCREAVRQSLKTHPWVLTPPAMHGQHFLAAAIGMDAELVPVIEGIPDGYYGKKGVFDCYGMLGHIALGLSSPELAAFHVKRIKIPLNSVSLMELWLRRTGDSELEYAAGFVCAQTKKDAALKFAEPIAALDSPRAVRPMLEIYLHSRAPKVARDWIFEKPARCVPALCSIAGEGGKLGESAIGFLCDFRAKGLDGDIREALAGCGEKAREGIEAAVFGDSGFTAAELSDADLPQDLAKSLTKRTVTGVDWLFPDDLPPIVVGSGRLSRDQVGRLLGVLKRAPISKPNAACAALKAHAKPEELERFT